MSEDGEAKRLSLRQVIKEGGLGALKLVYTNPKIETLDRNLLPPNIRNRLRQVSRPKSSL